MQNKQHGNKPKTLQSGRVRLLGWITGTSLLLVPLAITLGSSLSPATAVVVSPQPKTPKPAPVVEDPINQTRAAASAKAPAQPDLTHAYTAAASLQGAVMMGDWGAAEQALKAIETNYFIAPMNANQRKNAAETGLLLKELAISIRAHNRSSANEQAYSLGLTLLQAMEMRLPVASLGGGGGASGLPMSVLEHLRGASEAASRAQVALFGGDSLRAKVQLDDVRQHLKLVASSSPNSDLKRRVVEIDKLRWRVVATLADIPNAYRRGERLNRELMRAVAVEGRRALPAKSAPAGGGGGGRTHPAPMLQDAPIPTQAKH